MAMPCNIKTSVDSICDYMLHYLCEYANIKFYFVKICYNKGGISCSVTQSLKV